MSWTGADEIKDAESQTVDIEIWDYKASKSFRGEAQINLKDILDRGRMRETCRWGAGGVCSSTDRRHRRKGEQGIVCGCYPEQGLKVACSYQRSCSLRFGVAW